MSDIVYNKKASFDYDLEDRYEAGIILTGTEIKSIRDGGARLLDAYGVVLGNELWLLNSYIAEYRSAAMMNHEPRRTRKLLMHRHEIDVIAEKLKTKGYSLIPTRLFYVRGRVKVEIALAKGKKNYDKRAAIKERDEKREAAAEMKKWR